MKLVRWEFQGLHMPMMEDEGGELYCTSKAICEALGINEATMRWTYNQHKAEFDSLSVGKTNAKEFFQQNRAEFGIKRVRKDMRLWTEDDMLTFAFHSRSPESLEFRKRLRQFIKQNARRDYVSQEEFESLKGELENMKEMVHSLMRIANENASQAGKMLYDQKKSKHLRAVPDTGQQSFEL